MCVCVCVCCTLYVTDYHITTCHLPPLCVCSPVPITPVELVLVCPI